MLDNESHFIRLLLCEALVPVRAVDGFLQILDRIDMTLLSHFLMVYGSDNGTDSAHRSWRRALALSVLSERMKGGGLFLGETLLGVRPPPRGNFDDKG